MSVPPLSNNFSGGSGGAAITPANSGGASGDAFDVVSALPAYTTSNARPGETLAMQIAGASGAEYAGWNGMGSVTGTVYFRAYCWLSVTPVTNRCYILQNLTSGASSSSFLRVMTSSPVMSAADSADSGFGAEGTVPVNIGSWFRVEAAITPSATTGQLAWRLYNTPDSTTPDDSFTSPATLNLAANIDQCRFGELLTPPAVPFTAQYADLAVSTSGWIGPAAAGGGPAAVPFPFLQMRTELISRSDSRIIAR